MEFRGIKWAKMKWTSW